MPALQRGSGRVWLNERWNITASKHLHSSSICYGPATGRNYQARRLSPDSQARGPARAGYPQETAGCNDRYPFIVEAAVKIFCAGWRSRLLGAAGISDFDGLVSRRHDAEVELYAFDVLVLRRRSAATCVAPSKERSRANFPPRGAAGGTSRGNGADDPGRPRFLWWIEIAADRFQRSTARAVQLGDAFLSGSGRSLLTFHQVLSSRPGCWIGPVGQW